MYAVIKIPNSVLLLQAEKWRRIQITFRVPESHMTSSPVKTQSSTQLQMTNNLFI